jgi:hypothetical protein
MEDSERPNGSNATAAGWTLLALGVIAALFSGSTETFGAWVFALGLANLGIGLGVLLLSLGYLVRAIWFLPGREIPREERPQAAVSLSVCTWCDRDMTPYRACSTVSDEENRLRAPRLRDEACLAAFRTRGLAENPEQ